MKTPRFKRANGRGENSRTTMNSECGEASESAAKPSKQYMDEAEKQRHQRQTSVADQKLNLTAESKPLEMIDSDRQ